MTRGLGYFLFSPGSVSSCAEGASASWARETWALATGVDVVGPAEAMPACASDVLSLWRPDVTPAILTGSPVSRIMGREREMQE